MLENKLPKNLADEIIHPLSNENLEEQRLIKNEDDQGLQESKDKQQDETKDIIRDDINMVQNNIQVPDDYIIAKKITNRCCICNIKTKLNYFQCKCDESKMFCIVHRFPYNHNCEYDRKENRKRKLFDDNPLIVPAKLTKI